MEISDKLKILSAAAKYDAACTSSGVDRKGNSSGIGNAVYGGICHSFSADGRCISLLKVLMTNYCINDCQYCVARSSNDIDRAMFEPEELAELTMSFYVRNYIEGLFLSSGVIRNPDYTMERMCVALGLLRNKYKFNGYIHAKAIPGASDELITRLGYLCDRMSVNIELPSEKSLKMLAPQKSRDNILKPMKAIKNNINQNKQEIVKYKFSPSFVPAGQSTQMIIGATPDTDYQILRLSEGFYNSYKLRRVFYSAYIPVGNNSILPTVSAPLLREHRLYQADWLLRFYGFKANEILDDKNQTLDPILDPKCFWALNHLEYFPLEVNKADYYELLRAPGIGVTSAKRICMARRNANLSFEDLKKLGVVLKRAQYFITCKGKMLRGITFQRDFIYQNLSYIARKRPDFQPGYEQISFEDVNLLSNREERVKCLRGEI